MHNDQHNQPVDFFFMPVVMMSSIYEEKELTHVMEDYFVEGFFQKTIELSIRDQITTFIAGRSQFKYIAYYQAQP